jgi:UDP-glucose 4-epimerase
VGIDVEPQFKPRDVLVSRRAADISRALDVLGWKPTIDLATGMQDVVDNEIA